VKPSENARLRSQNASSSPSGSSTAGSGGGGGGGNVHVTPPGSGGSGSVSLSSPGPSSLGLTSAMSVCPTCNQPIDYSRAPPPGAIDAAYGDYARCQTGTLGSPPPHSQQLQNQYSASGGPGGPDSIPVPNHGGKVPGGNSTYISSSTSSSSLSSMASRSPTEGTIIDRREEERNHGTPRARPLKRIWEADYDTTR